MENPIFDAISKVDEKSVEQPTTPTASTTEVQTTETTQNNEKTNQVQAEANEQAETKTETEAVKKEEAPENVEVKTEEPAPPVPNPLDELPEDVREYAQAKKENPDLKFDEFIKEKNFDVNSLSTLEVAREKAIRESKGKITKDNVDAYLERETGILLTDENLQLDEFDELDLEKFIGDFRNEFNKEEKQTPQSQNNELDELVDIGNGYKAPKSVLDQQSTQQKLYEENVEKAVANSTSFDFKTKFDVGNGEFEEVVLSFDISKEIKDKTLSIAKGDIIANIDSLFRDPKSKAFNHQEYVKALAYLNPETREQIIEAQVQKAVANRIEKILKQEYNPNFKGINRQQTIPKARPATPIQSKENGTVQVDFSKF
jgi:hypothetical protein